MSEWKLYRALALIVGTEYILEAMIYGLRVVWRQHGVGQPFAAVDVLAIGTLGIDVLGPYGIGKAEVAALQAAVLGFGLVQHKLPDGE